MHSLSSSLMVNGGRDRMECKRITGSREDFLFWKEDFSAYLGQNMGRGGRRKREEIMGQDAGRHNLVETWEREGLSTSGSSLRELERRP